MYKYIIIVLILCALASNAIAQNSKILRNELNVVAQNRNTRAKEITNQMSVLKKGYEKRQIEFKDSIYSTPLMEITAKKNLSKDSLRHLLINKGFNDFNFEHFEFKIKKLAELNEEYINQSLPQLYRLLSDSTFNKVTYSFKESTDGINVSIILSENDVIFDDDKEISGGVNTAGVFEYVTFRGYCKKKGITYCEENSYSNVIRNLKNKQYDIKPDEKNHFKITVNTHSNRDKYIGIIDSTGKILSITKP